MLKYWCLIVCKEKFSIHLYAMWLFFYRSDHFQVVSHTNWIKKSNIYNDELSGSNNNNDYINSQQIEILVQSFPRSMQRWVTFWHLNFDVKSKNEHLNHRKLPHTHKYASHTQHNTVSSVFILLYRVNSQTATIIRTFASLYALRLPHNWTWLME